MLYSFCCVIQIHHTFRWSLLPAASVEVVATVKELLSGALRRERSHDALPMSLLTATTISTEDVDKNDQRSM